MGYAVKGAPWTNYNILFYGIRLLGYTKRAKDRETTSLYSIVRRFFL